MSTTTLSSPPAVLLCNSCNTIISDTQELRGEAAELGAFIVNGKRDCVPTSVRTRRSAAACSMQKSSLLTSLGDSLTGVENVTVDSVQQQVHLPSGDTRYARVLQLQS